MEEIRFDDSGIHACRYSEKGAMSHPVVLTELAPEHIAGILHEYLLNFDQGVHKIDGEYVFNLGEVKRTLEERLKAVKASPTDSFDRTSIMLGTDGPEELYLCFRRILFAMKGCRPHKVYSTENALFVEYNFERYNTTRQPLPREINLLNSLSCVSQKTL